MRYLALLLIAATIFGCSRFRQQELKPKFSRGTCVAYVNLLWTRHDGFNSFRINEDYPVCEVSVTSVEVIAYIFEDTKEYLMMREDPGGWTSYRTPMRYVDAQYVPINCGSEKEEAKRRAKKK